MKGQFLQARWVPSRGLPRPPPPATTTLLAKRTRECSGFSLPLPTACAFDFVAGGVGFVDALDSCRFSVDLQLAHHSMLEFLVEQFQQAVFAEGEFLFHHARVDLYAQGSPVESD